MRRDVRSGYAATLRRDERPSGVLIAFCTIVAPSRSADSCPQEMPIFFAWRCCLAYGTGVA
jgi:hypothetical protein